MAVTAQLLGYVAGYITTVIGLFDRLKPY